MQVSASQLLPFIVLMPLVGAFVNGIFGHRFSRRTVHTIGVGSVAISLLLALRAFYALAEVKGITPLEPALAQTVYTWAATGMFHFDVAFALDSLSAIMLLIVTGVGLLIHIYSTGYMSDEPSIHRYFAYLNLFMFSMLCLILGKNLLMLFVGWEGVGVCSYLLIGFWFTDDQKAQAGQKAFIVNRIGDFGFIIGMALLVYHAHGTSDFDSLRWHFENTPHGPFHDQDTLTVACLLLFIGACGKSAQIPLYVWLPDAMAGPTPVSALIHAATMVTAGVYMIARLSFMFTLSPIAMGVIASVGACTALAAALMALTQRDIKGVLAYSTVSQLGYMILAVGVGAYAAGVFHLMTHAFFKALLFLAAGSVIHGLGGQQDIFKMGGLKAKMPITRMTFLLATCAIAGIPLFSGSYSKGEILKGVKSLNQLHQVPDRLRAAYSDGENVYIGGQAGVVLGTSGESWDKWRLPRTGSPDARGAQQIPPAVRAITVGSDGTVWAATEFATIYQKSGSTWVRHWQAAEQHRHKHLNAATAVGDAVWFVGDAGLIVRCAEDKCAQHNGGTAAPLYAVAGTSDTAVYAGGSQNAFIKWNGTAWAPEKLVTTATVNTLTAVDGTIWGGTGGGPDEEPSLFKLGAHGFEKVKLEAAGVLALRGITAVGSGGGPVTVAATVSLADGKPPQPAIFTQLSEAEAKEQNRAWDLTTGEPGTIIRSLGLVGGTIYAAGDGKNLLTRRGSALVAQHSVPHKPWYHQLLWIIGVLVGGLTAFYMFRLYFLTFEGETRCDTETWGHAHESPPSMTVPLVILAILSVGGGWFAAELAEWLAPTFRIANTRLAPAVGPVPMLWMAKVTLVLGIGLAAVWYLKGSKTPANLARAMPGVYRTLKNKFYVDEAYALVVIGPYRLLARFFHKVVDVVLIDGALVNGAARIVASFGRVFRALQSGDVQQYAVAIVVGLAILIGVMGI